MPRKPRLILPREEAIRLPMAVSGPVRWLPALPPAAGPIAGKTESIQLKVIISDKIIRSGTLLKQVLR